MQKTSDYQARLKYKQKGTGLLFLILSAIAVTMITKLNAWSLKNVITIFPFLFLMLLLAAIKIQDWFAIQKFGAVEKREQLEKELSSRIKIQKMLNTEEHKRKRYIEKYTALAGFALFLLLSLPAIKISKMYSISEWITLNIAFFTAYAVSFLIAQKKADKKFPLRQADK